MTTFETCPARLVRRTTGGSPASQGILSLAAVGAWSLLVFALLSPRPAAANDWPQFRGPARDGVSAETGLLKRWPAGGPKLVWKGRNLGEGHGTVSVARGRVYGMGLRGQDEVVWALDERNGNPIWSRRIAGLTRLGGEQGGFGPRCAPTVDGNRLYVLGVGGQLACLDARSGNIVWQHNLPREYQADVPQWGYSESPLVDGNRVVVAPGGRKATIVAFNKASGAQVWACQTGRDSAHYASALAADVDGVRQYIHFLSGGVIGVSAADGKLLWRYDRPANGVANCSMPIYRDHIVFAASNYGSGGGAARLQRAGGGTSAREIYMTKEMQNHHGGVVLVGDYLYGFDQGTLRCIEFKTGRTVWSNRSVGKGSVTYADGHIIARAERGPVGLIQATPRGYVEDGRFDQPEQSGREMWPYPVVANGRLYLRDQDKLFCYDIRQTAR